MSDSHTYDKLSVEEMLRMADQHTDPFVKSMARRLDATSYQVSIYRQMLGLPKLKEPQQLDLFEGTQNG